MTMKSADTIWFNKKEAATLLRCSPQTMVNRENTGVYPPAQNHSYGVNKIRSYSLEDIFNLMYITHKQIYMKPILDLMQLKGYYYPTLTTATAVKANTVFYNKFESSFKKFQMTLAATPNTKSVENDST